MKTFLLTLSMMFLACTADASEPVTCERLHPGLLIGDVYALMQHLDTTNQDYIGVATDGGMEAFMDLYPEHGRQDVGTPSWVYIQFTTLDSRAGSRPEYIVDNLFELAGRVEATMPGIPVYVSTIPPVKGLTGRKLSLWEKTNQLILERGGYAFESFSDVTQTISADTGCADPSSPH